MSIDFSVYELRVRHIFSHQLYFDTDDQQLGSYSILPLIRLIRTHCGISSRCTSGQVWKEGIGSQISGPQTTSLLLHSAAHKTLISCFSTISDDLTYLHIHSSHEEEFFVPLCLLPSYDIREVRRILCPA